MNDEQAPAHGAKVTSEPYVIPAQIWKEETIIVFRGPIKGLDCIGVIYTSAESAVLGDLERVFWEIYESGDLHAFLASGSCDGRETAKKQIEAAVEKLNEET
jgi:hypothetical protein